MSVSLAHAQPADGVYLASITAEDACAKVAIAVSIAATAFHLADIVAAVNAEAIQALPAANPTTPATIFSFIDIRFAISCSFSIKFPLSWSSLALPLHAKFSKLASNFANSTELSRESQRWRA
jgi:hypothetical protein